MAQFLCVLRPCRPTLAQDATEAELAIIGQHFEHLQVRHSEGRLHVAGRTEGGEIGVIIFDAADAHDASGFIARDPAVVEGLMTPSVYPFRLALSSAPDG